MNTIAPNTCETTFLTLRRCCLCASTLFLVTQAIADEPVVIFRSVDDVRQEVDRWDAEEPSPYDSDRIIDVTVGGDEPTLGIKLDEDPLGPEVEAVVSGSAADKAGMKKGDHLESIGNAKVESISDAAALVERHPIGKVMELKFQRNNYTYERRIRFSKDSDGPVRADADSVYTRERVEELERRLKLERKRSLQLRSAVRYLLSDRTETE